MAANKYTRALEKAKKQLGTWVAVGRACGVTPEAVGKWRRAGRPPRTEYTGETRYAAAIAKACDGAVAEADLRPIQGSTKRTHQNAA